MRVIDGICQRLRVAAHQFAREGVGQLVVGIYSPVIEETFLTEQIFQIGGGRSGRTEKFRFSSAVALKL